MAAKELEEVQEILKSKRYEVGEEAFGRLFAIYKDLGCAKCVSGRFRMEVFCQLPPPLPFPRRRLLLPFSS
jgi:hypothetical protein